MADAVILSITGEIIANLVPQALDMVGKLRGVKHELELLKDTVSMLQPWLDHAKEQYHHNPQIQDWVDKLKDACYDAQDVLEEFNIEAMRRKLRGHNEMMKKVRTFISSSNQLAFKWKMSDKVRAVRERIQAIEAKKKFYLEERPVDSRVERQWRKRKEMRSIICERDITGRDDDKKRVMKFLQDLDVKENISILPIVGIGGLGKTALAKSVYEDSKFDLKMWVCVSDDFDMKKIMKDIIACAKGKESIDVATERLPSELRAAIDGKRYLLVLDDWWNKERETWLSLKTLLVGGARGSKILITTRLLLVAKITGSLPYLLEGLSESASLDLLLQMADRKIEEIQESDMLAIGKEIVRKCSGVPLVVRVVGCLLFFKKSVHEWSQFKDNELPDVFQKEDSIKLVLKLSYDNLPSHLKRCFALCSLFPKDYEIKKQTLVNLWVAEGFIQPSNRSPHLEDIAHGYFMDLLWSNCFQDYQEDNGTCKMHDFMHDLACLVAGTECWVAWDNTKSIHERTRHMSYGSTFNLIGQLPISALRTFLSIDGYWKESMSEAYLRQLIQSFKTLRILDLRGTFPEKVPRSICKLKYLTYLDLSSNHNLKRLPNSIMRLHNLQTLNLYNCSVLEKLPRGIRKLVSLRNLDIDDCWKLSYVPRGLGQLNSLHRLTRFILPKRKALAKNYCRLGELNGLNNIMGSLCIENLESVIDVEAESRAANLIGKRSLESLALKWGDFDTNDAVIVDRDAVLLDGLQPHSSVQKLAIEGYKGESFPRWMMDSLVSSLPNLVEVRLRNCKRCKRLSSLGQLPHLKTLDIQGLTELEYIESDHSSTSTGSFPSMLKLEIYGCMKLKAMPLAPHLERLGLTKANPALINMIAGLNKLKSLDIRKMEFLECLPEECWKSLASLESLIICECPGLTSLSTPTPPLGTRHQSNEVDLDFSDSEELDLSKYHESSSGNNNLFLELHSLRFVYIHCLPKLASLPQWLLQASNLEVLSIQNCEELDLSKYHESSSGNNHHLILELQSLRKVEILFLPKLASLPQWLLQASNLEDLSLSHCEELDLSKDENGNILNFHGGLQSLRSVEINRLPKLASLPPWLLQASNLEDLSIWSCEELDICKDESGNIILDFHGGLQSLRSLNLFHLPKLASLPQWLLQAGNLKRLEIEDCSNLKELPEQIEALQSLQRLEIKWCPSLTSLPEGMRRLASLTHLQIYDCPELERRCKRDAGEDWYKIAHIPHIYIY